MDKLDKKNAKLEKLVKITKELHKLIQKYISDDGSFESCSLSFEINKYYEWYWVMMAIDKVNSFETKIDRVGYYNQNKNQKRNIVLYKMGKKNIEKDLDN